MLETIVALATPPLRSALSIVRLSGNDCFSIVSNFFSKDLTQYEKNQLIHGYIKDGDQIVDEVVLLLYKNPRSFTGEDSVEIISHGSPIIYNKIIELALKFGARMAERGEYSSRAFMNNKLDLIQAESINDLINAETEEAKNISMMALTGKTSNLITPLKKKVGDLLSTIEANIDYSEYTDIEEMDSSKIIDFCKDIINEIDILIGNGRKGKIIKEGINIAIVGKPNVGKSSILNSLLNEEKAIVTDIKGTTRDIVEGKINLNGIIINLFDTAGIRESSDKVESIGIKKSIDAAMNADIVIAVFDSSEMDDEDKEILNLIKDKKHLIVFNKKDKFETHEEGKLYVSALNNDLEPLKQAILNILELDEDNYTNPSLANDRELGLLEGCKHELNEVIKEANFGVTIDMLSERIRNAYLKVLAISGEDCDFDVAKEIFSRFCLGK